MTFYSLPDLSLLYANLKRDIQLLRLNVAAVGNGGGSSTTDASLLTSELLDDARLSTNVALKSYVISQVGGKEPIITAGTTGQYWRGDKSWFTLDKAAVGLSNVPNTDFTSSISAKEPTITAGTTLQYWRGDKSWQTLDKTAIGLSNVPNSDPSTLYLPLAGGTLSGALTATIATNAAIAQFTAANTSSDSIVVKSTSTSGYSSVGFKDNTGATTGSFGYGNASASVFAGSIFFSAVSKPIRFSIDGGTTSNMSIISGGLVGIGITTPVEQLHLQKTASTGCYTRVDCYGGAPGFQTYRINGTTASSTAVASGDFIGLWSMRGFGTALNSYASAYVGGQATQAWTGTANGTSLLFATTPNNSTTAAVNMFIDQNGFVGLGNGTTTPRQALSFGSTSALSSTTPLAIDMGGSYGSNTLGAQGNLKLIIYNDGTNKSGIGISLSNIEYQAGSGISTHNFFITNASKFKIDATNTTALTNFVFGTDNTYDIGASAATRPRTAYLGTSVRSPKFETAASVQWTSGTGSPESVVTANVGSLYTRTDGGANTTLYVKESGAGNTGWIAK